MQDSLGKCLDKLLSAQEEPSQRIGAVLFAATLLESLGRGDLLVNEARNQLQAAIEARDGTTT